MPPLTDTISSAGEGTVVDGVNLDEIREFAKQFKIRRLSLGLTQTQVGQALSATEGPSYSQSAICRSVPPHVCCTVVVLIPSVSGLMRHVYVLIVWYVHGMLIKHCMYSNALRMRVQV